MGAVLSSANAASTPTITAESGKSGPVKAQSPMEGATSDKDIKTGTPAFRRVTLALTAAGFSTFAVLYCVQPLLPVFTAKFHVSPAESSLALSLSTGLLGIGLLIAGPLSDVWGRKPVMVGSLFASALLTLVAAVEPSWTALLLMRALAGLTLGGVPAVAKAYLSEEMHAARRVEYHRAFFLQAKDILHAVPPATRAGRYCWRASAR